MLKTAPPPPPQTKGDDAKSKAQKKREKERAKAKEREERIAAEKAGSGPSPREVELALIARNLLAGGAVTAVGTEPPVPRLQVHEVLSDGHCLYRAIDHQLELRGLRPAGLRAVGLRNMPTNL